MHGLHGFNHLFGNGKKTNSEASLIKFFRINSPTTIITATPDFISATLS